MPSGSAVVGLSQRLGQTFLARPDVVLPRVIGAVSEPQAHRRRAHLGRDLDALEEVVGRLAAHLWVRVADTAEAVFVLLEHVRVYGADAQAQRRPRAWPASP